MLGKALPASHDHFSRQGTESYVYSNAPAGTEDLDVLFLPVKFFDRSTLLLIQNDNPRVAFEKAAFAASLIFA